MAIRLEARRRFEATSPVARYWLTQCHGFRVGGVRKGTVEEIVSTSDPYAPELLIVRNVYRRREIPVSTVEAVVPAERLIVVGDGVAAGDRRRRRRPVRTLARSASRAAAPVRVAAAQHGPSLLRQLGRVARRGAAAVALAVVVLARLSKALVLAAVRGGGPSRTHRSSSSVPAA